jgi:hypothetical protein
MSCRTTSRFHHHSGVEGFFVVDGQCLETADRTHDEQRGTLVVSAGIPMRLVATDLRLDGHQR